AYGSRPRCPSRAAPVPTDRTGTTHSNRRSGSRARQHAAIMHPDGDPHAKKFPRDTTAARRATEMQLDACQAHGVGTAAAPRSRRSESGEPIETGYAAWERTWKRWR